jgi:hypothetical protein
MKHTLAAILFMLAINASAQVEMTYADGGAQFQQVIEAEGKAAADLYKSVIRWVNVAYKNPESVISAQLENELVKGNGAGDVIMPGIMPVNYTYRYHFTIDIKDGKVRITVNDMKILTNSGTFAVESYIFKSDGSKRTNNQAKGIESDITSDMTVLFASLKQGIMNPDKKDDW